MKKISSAITGVVVAACLTIVAQAYAKDITITGEGKCGKCSLKETEKCQNVIQVEKDHKTTTYYLVQNDVSKNFHDNLCKEPKKVTATGTVKTVEGKKEFTATKIELVK